MKIMINLSSNLRNDSFVCVDDITGYPVEMNRVIYNPSKDNFSFRVELLFKSIKEAFGIELSSGELMDLCMYDVYHLNDFVDHLKDTIEKKK